MGGGVPPHRNSGCLFHAEYPSDILSDVTYASVLSRTVYVRTNADEYWTFVFPLVSQRQCILRA
jgi:hypothetical protein